MPEQNLSITGRNLIAFNEKTQAFYLLEGKCSNLKDINTICLNYRDKLISLETLLMCLKGFFPKIKDYFAQVY